MKYLFAVYFLCLASYSQSYKQSSVLSIEPFKLNSQIALYNTTFNKPDFSLLLKSNELGTFSIYNRNTKLNDIYSTSNNTLQYLKSTPINSNNYSQKDSFNPNGVNNIQSCLIMGALNTAFKSLFN